MDYEHLHSSTLENLFGPIRGHVIRQDKNIRLIHLLDRPGISRTLGIVRFLNIDNPILTVAHGKILEGGLLGKTLCDADIDFDKEFIGALEIQLPDWLKQDFKTQQDSSVCFFSKISVRTNALSNGKFLYSELIEIVPPEIKDLFVTKTKPLDKIDENLLSLFKAAGLTGIKLSKKR